MSERWRRYAPTWLLRLAAFEALALAWYWPARYSGWVTDILGLVPRLETAGLSGAWTGYGSPVFHPLTLGAHYLLWHGAGPQSLPYYLTWTLLHGLTAWMVAEGVRVAAGDLGLRRARESGWWAGLLFAVHPYVVEAVVWRATLNYLLCVPLMLGACWGAYAFAKTGGRGGLLASVTLGGLALLSFDLAWVTWALSGVAALAGAHGGAAGARRRRVGVVLSLQAIVLLGYLAAKTAVIGDAVGHYGAERHLNADPAIVLPNAWRQLTKLLFLTRQYGVEAKAGLTARLGEPAYYLSLTAASLGLLVWWLVSAAPRSRRWYLAGLFGVATVVTLLPTANLYYYWLLHGENDRYSYLPATAACAILALGLGALPHRGIRVGAAAVLLVAYAYFSRVHVGEWVGGASVQAALIDDFPRLPRGRVIALAAADNYCGTYLFRDANLPYTSLHSHLRFLRGRAPADTVENLVNFNQMHPGDSVAAWVNDRGEIELTFRQGGNWFWRGGIGLSDYERPGFRVTAGYPVRICFKDPLPTSTTLLYPTGGTWTALPHAGLRTCAEVDARAAAAQ